MRSFRRRAARARRNLNPLARANYPILWLSDSIYNMDSLAARVENGISASYSGSSVRATYGGETIGAGLIEVADSTQAYVNGAWTDCVRSLPFSYFKAAVFEFGRNDGGEIVSGVQTTADYRKAYDKLLDQCRKYFPRVVSGTCPPKADGGATPSTWDVANDEYISLGLSSVLSTVNTKWNARFYDVFTDFQNLVTAGTYTVTQLMRDAYHPTLTTGANIIGDAIVTKLNDSTAMTVATPEITGNVVNYLYGQPTAGTWTFSSVSPNTVGPNNSPIARISTLADQALRVASTGARVVFPSTKCAQVWVHFFRLNTGGSFTCYIDRGTGTEKSITINSTHIYNNYADNRFVGAGGLDPSVSHTIEIETTNSTEVKILGVTCVGVS